MQGLKPNPAKPESTGIKLMIDEITGQTEHETFYDHLGF